jgi:hypothetical protein
MSAKMDGLQPFDSRPQVPLGDAVFLLLESRI